MPKLPSVAHGDTQPIVKIGPKSEGQGPTRHVTGSQITIMLLFDNCAQVPVAIPGLDASMLPSPELVTERNMKMDFLVARFRDLSITYSGGDYGAIRYKGTASGVEFLNLNPSTAQNGPAPTK